MAPKRATPKLALSRPPIQQKINFGQAPIANTQSHSDAKKTVTSASPNIDFTPPPKALHGFHIAEHSGDLFAAPANTLLIHACNCRGSWGAGIALAFRKHYPNAFEIYAQHCRDTKDARKLLGTALLIPPQNGDIRAGRKHWVGCLFTSVGYGTGRDDSRVILEATSRAMGELVERIRGFAEGRAEEGEEGEIGEVRICKINSGLFGVPWELSRAVLEGVEVGGEGQVGRELEVWEREGT